MIMFSETVASGTVAITPSNDTVLEYDEMFTLSLTTDDQFLDVSSTTTITITDTTGETKHPIAADPHLLLLSLSQWSLSCSKRAPSLPLKEAQLLLRL